MGEIWVENEYAPLKTVVLAQSEICVPRSALEDPDMSFLPERPTRLGFTGDLRDADPPRQQAWEAERRALAAVLDRHGVRILRPRLLTAAEKEAAGDRGVFELLREGPVLQRR
ncbi:hypothetical protein [Nocardia vermiculata]|uniref:hypothetical protein n=1 Tax=Nocardia vermiculata TaxID=257274 RepID=UPI000B2E2F82|nr:hypothetical protein [Nocardia vermiculata]